jgi:outer membrane protein insertion porin family
MLKSFLVAAALLGAASPLFAQGDIGRCVTPDSITVTGNKRIPATTILLDAGLAAGTALNSPTMQRAIKNVYQSGQFETIRVDCVVTGSTPPKAVLILKVVERPLLDFVDVTGVKALSPRDVKERVDLLVGRPIDPSQIAHAIQRIDSLYQASGYYLARIKPDTTITGDGHASVVFKVDEGTRLAISGVRIQGNRAIDAKGIVGSMKTKPERFFFWQKGEFDQEKYAKDLGEAVPQLYLDRGYLDFQVVSDSLIVDRSRGKALVDVRVTEGPQYAVGSFEVTGSKRFNSQDIARFYPFEKKTPSLPDRVKALIKRKPVRTNQFDQSAWDDATNKVRQAYANEGYIYSSVRPILDRQMTDSGPRVNLRWDVQEGQPAIINRVEILGNDYTVESCIRDQLLIIPGGVYNQEALMRSYQSIGNLGFFETPVPFPETRQANDQGDVDIVFKVKEKRTGNVNFGASMGQGTGLGGFIGLEQPNLFGRCKRGTLNWQYGRYINDFQLSYTDPAIKQSRVSGTLTAYRSQSRYTIADLGQTTRTGGSVRVAMPLFGARFVRFGVTYGAEAVRYGGDGLLGSITTNNCAGCFRSTMGFDVTRDTRVEVPFPTDGTLQTFTAQFNGGPLGGSASFQRYTSEFKTYATLMRIGGDKPGSAPVKIVAGLSQRAGMVFGNPGPFFASQAFSLGGVQYGEPLRGYPEFSITPLGFDPGTSQSNASRTSFGNAFFSATAEVGVRLSSQFYFDFFYDAGNLWAAPRDFNPTRLFRGAGVGASIISPLGPLGLDWAYGFDRLDTFGRPDPKWQLHFRLGQFFY